MTFQGSFRKTGPGEWPPPTSDSTMPSVRRTVRYASSLSVCASPRLRASRLRSCRRRPLCRRVSGCSTAHLHPGGGGARMFDLHSRAGLPRLVALGSRGRSAGGRRCSGRRGSPLPPSLGSPPSCNLPRRTLAGGERTAISPVAPDHEPRKYRQRSRLVRGHSGTPARPSVLPHPRVSAWRCSAGRRRAGRSGTARASARSP